MKKFALAVVSLLAFVFVLMPATVEAKSSKDTSAMACVVDNGTVESTWAWCSSNMSWEDIEIQMIGYFQGEYGPGELVLLDGPCYVNGGYYYEFMWLPFQGRPGGGGGGGGSVTTASQVK